jgi:hypothetical protein
VLGVRGLRRPAVGEERGKREEEREICLKMWEESFAFNLGRERRESRVSNLKKFHVNGGLVMLNEIRGVQKPGEPAPPRSAGFKCVFLQVRGRSRV